MIDLLRQLSCYLLVLLPLSGNADTERAIPPDPDAAVATANTGADTAGASPEPVSDGAGNVRIRLEFHYRENVSSGNFDRNSLTIALSSEDTILEIDDSVTQRIDFQDIYVLVTAFSSSFVAHFFDKHDDNQLQGILYQSAGGLENTFGSHGFTGLHYIYHKSGAELQYWAIVEE